MIEEYTFGSMTIDGHHYSSDLKIFPNHITSNWWRKEGHVLKKLVMHGKTINSPRIRRLWLAST